MVFGHRDLLPHPIILVNQVALCSVRSLRTRGGLGNFAESKSSSGRGQWVGALRWLRQVWTQASEQTVGPDIRPCGNCWGQLLAQALLKSHGTRRVPEGQLDPDSAVGNFIACLMSQQNERWHYCQWHSVYLNPEVKNKDIPKWCSRCYKEYVLGYKSSSPLLCR